MTGRALIAEGAACLKEAGVASPEHDARSLFLAASGCTLKDYILRAGEDTDPETEARYRSYLKRRSAREPLQYIAGRAPFYGREFLVGNGVLIPRFDTETLVEAVLPHMRSGMRILDLCTGSGCILLTLLLEGPEHVRGLGTDREDAALEIARRNAALYPCDASFEKHDLFLHIDGRYDIITANPPYIPGGEIPQLEEEVRDYEMRAALDGGADGLHFYRLITAGAGDHLKPGGLLAFEIGKGQAEAVRGLMSDAGFSELRTDRDLTGRERVVLGVYG